MRLLSFLNKFADQHKAAAAMTDVRKKIFDALESLSGTVKWSSEFLELYETDDALAVKAEELYLSLLELIEGIMEWVDHKAYVEATKSFFQQTNYGKPIKKKIEAMEEKSNAFQKRIEYLLHERMMSVENEVKVLRRENSAQNRTLMALLFGFFKDADCKIIIVIEVPPRSLRNRVQEQCHAAHGKD